MEDNRFSHSYVVIPIDRSIGRPINQWHHYLLLSFPFYFHFLLLNKQTKHHILSNKTFHMFLFQLIFSVLSNELNKYELIGFEANAPVDIATTMHWFAQIGHDFVDERDNGEGKRRV